MKWKRFCSKWRRRHEYGGRFSRLGLKTAAVARFGDDLAGQWVAKELGAEKFDQRFLLQIKGDKTDYSTILVGDNGERVILVARGQSRLEKKIFPFPKLPPSRWVYLSSLEGNIPLLEKIIFWAKERGSKIALNPGSRELKEKKKTESPFAPFGGFNCERRGGKRFLGEKLASGDKTFPGKNNRGYFGEKGRLSCCRGQVN